MRLKNLSPFEADEQKALFEWAAYARREFPELELMYHIPNGGTRHPAEARNLRLQGVKPGVPDIFLPAMRGGYGGLYIEMKRRKGGVVSGEQKRWMAELNKAGYCVAVCRGWEQARCIITDYLRIGRNTNDR